MPASSNERPEELRPWTVIDQYRVVRLLGRGGMGEVYLARDAYLGRMVALKLLLAAAARSPEWVRMFLDEAQAIAKLSHPNVVTVYGIGQHEGRPYLSLEYVEGVTLRQRAQHERLSLREVVHVGRSLALALEAAHAKGIVHRDLKPGNVLIGIDGRVRVLDFGVAKLLSDGQPERLLDPAGPTTARPKKRFGTPHYMAPEQWRGEESTPSDVWALGIILYEIVAGHVPYLERGAGELARAVCSEDPVPVPAAFRTIPSALGDLILRCLEKDPDRRPTVGEAKGAFEAMASKASRRPGEEINPFRGLLPFTERHADLFFGRDAELASFLERLRHGVVFPVVGPSGVGKSSFVRAGVVPRLAEQGSWVVIRMRPLGSPLLTLAARLRGAGRAHDASSRTSGSPSSPPARGGLAGPDRPEAAPDRAAEGEPGGVGEGSTDRDLALRLLETPELLSVILAELAARTGSHVLLFVDQLEEVLTLTEDEAERRAFLDGLCTAAFDPEEPVRVLLTLRDDFLGRIPWGKGANEALGNVTLLRTPGPGALREVVTRPLAQAGYRFEDEGLVSEILESFGDGASLPLLQFALRRLWDRRDRNGHVLTRSAYLEMGAVGGALAEHADQVLAALRPHELDLARELLLRLVTPEGTRRMVSRERLLEGLGPDATEVLDRLVKARLLALHRRSSGADGVDVELAHDSLIATWGTLSRWIDGSREELRALAELAEAAELWERHGRRQDQLWEGDALRDAERTLRRATSPVPDVLSRFVAAGAERRRRERRRRRRLRAALATMVGLVTLASILAAWALAAREREALRGQAVAERGRAALLEEGARTALRREQPIEAAAKLRAALEVRDSAALRMLWRDLLSQPLSWRYPTNGIVYDVELSPDGRLLAAASQAGLVYLVSVESLEARRLRGQGDQVLAVAFSPDGELLASSSWAGAVSLWDTATGALRDRWSVEGAVPSLSFSRDGRLLAAASSRGGVHVTELGPRGSTEHVAAGLPETRSVEFGPEGDLLVAAGADHAVWLLHARGGEEVRRFDLGTPIDSAAISPDGNLVAASAGGVVTIWETRGAAPPKTIRAATGRIRDLDFSPDSTRLAVGGYDRTLGEWDLATGEQLLSEFAPEWYVMSVDYDPSGERLAAARGKALEIVRAGRRGATGAAKRIELDDRPLLFVAFSPDGSKVATSGGGITVWDVARGLPTASIDGALKVRGLRFGAGGATLIAALEQGAIETWDAATGASIRSFELGASRRAQSLDFDETLGFAVGCVSGEVLLVDAQAGEVERSAVLHAGPVVGVALVPVARQVLSVGRDGKLLRWDLESGASAVLLEQRTPFVSVAVSPDGATVAASDEDGSIAVLDRESAAGRSTFRLEGRVYRIELLPDGRRLVAACSDGFAHVIDVESSTRSTLRGHRREVNWLAASPDGELVATVGDDSTLRLFRTSDGRPGWHGVGLVGPSALTWGHRGWLDARGRTTARPSEPWARLVESARLTSSDAEGLCVATFDDRLVRWDFDADRPAFERPATGVEKVVAGPGGCLSVRGGEARLTTPALEQTLAAGATAASWDGDRLLVATRSEILTFDRGGRPIGRASAEPGITAMHRSGGLLALGFAEGTLLLRPEGSSQTDGNGLQDTPISGVAVVEDGPMNTLVVGFENGFVGLWDVSTGALLGHVRLHGAITGLARAGGGVVAATDLGDHGILDLSALLRPYCDVLGEVWREVPFLWQGEVTAVPDPPADHACRP